MLEMELGGARYKLDPAAISALRYRAAYGDSMINHLDKSRTAREKEALLLRVCWMMIPPANRPELRAFARQARRDGRFVLKAWRAVRELLSADPRAPKCEEPGGEAFDEYDLVAAMAAVGLDMELLRELPLLHLAGIILRRVEMQDPDRTTYRPMTAQERSALYPRRKKK